MSRRGEQLLIAATIDPVEQGQEFRTIPSHMTVIGWLSFAERQRHFLDHALESIFKQDYFQETVGGKSVKFGPNNDIPAREMRHVETAPWFALHALAKSVQAFPDDDPFIDVFSPHVTDTPDYRVKRGQKIAFPTVAVFARQPDDVTKMKRVQAVYPLGSQREV